MRNVVISALIFVISIASVFAEDGSELAPTVKTNLVIYRADSSARNGMIHYRIYVDGNHIGKLKRDTVMNLQLSAGEHIISVNNRERTKIAVLIREHAVTYLQSDLNRKRKLSLTVTQPSAQMVDRLMVPDSSGTPNGSGELIHSGH